MLDGPFPNTRDEAIARLEQGLDQWNAAPPEASVTRNTSWSSWPPSTP
ncbi:hypothetical protein G7085_13635 [Tessaracoccus sp. HDW20]|nr:hypothetical protein [Tessaracoccus coleopterorum]NHB85313.1 hypothetical protein [Tessaracoccus coleopterorum]